MWSRKAQESFLGEISSQEISRWSPKCGQETADGSKWNCFKLASLFFRGWSFWRDKRPASAHWDGALSVTVALWYITASAVPFSSHPDKVMIIPTYCTVQDRCQTNIRTLSQKKRAFSLQSPGIQRGHRWTMLGRESVRRLWCFWVLWFLRAFL